MASSVQGNWQTQGQSLALQGIETTGFLNVPYSTLVTFNNVSSHRLDGISASGEAIVFQRHPQKEPAGRSVTRSFPAAGRSRRSSRLPSLAPPSVLNLEHADDSSSDACAAPHNARAQSIKKGGQ